MPWNGRAAPIGVLQVHADACVPDKEAKVKAQAIELCKRFPIYS